MGVTKSFVLLLLVSIATDAWSHRHHRHEHSAEYRKENSHADFVEQEQSNFGSEKTVDSTQSELLEKNKKHMEALSNKGFIPFSPRRLEKMLEKAILKIITGDLGTAEMLLLKSLNYTPEEVLAIRERELNRQKEEESRKVAESNARKFYSENLYGNKVKHLNYNSMEFDSSPRNDPDVDVSRNERKRNRYKEKASYDKDFDFDAYNRQAVIDYENLASKFELQQWSEPATFDYEDELRNTEEQESSQNIHRSFDRVMEPHVIFKIPYDDSEFDSSSGSDEKSKFAGRDVFAPFRGSKRRASSTLRHTTAKNVANSFHASSLSPSSSSSSSASFAASAATGHTLLPVAYQLRNFKNVRPDYLKNQASLSTTESPEPIIASTIVANVTSNATAGTITDFNNSTNNDNFFKDLLKDADNTTSKKVSEYEGLEWVEDDVYRVIPGYTDSLMYDNADESEPSDYEEQNLGSLPDGSENDTLEYQNDAPETRLFMVNASVENASLANPSTFQQLALAENREKENVTSSFDSQIKQAIEDIKKKILALTGRFNHSTSTNQVHQEKLDMFSPTCQIPRNTDSEAWTDPFSMNMHFQLNLTSGNHVVAAKLRIYKLPQENLTTSASEGFDEDEDDEKKIRISVYHYTKSLKKHRSKKRLMDSVVTPLTANGTHLALDVRQGLRFWRLTPQNPHGNGNNHGLVIQIEDQDGQPLKPALYIQQPSCGEDHVSDPKPSEHLHFSLEPVLVTFVL